MCWCIAIGIRISWVASIGVIVQGRRVSTGLGSWVLSSGFCGWCIKVVSILFICVSRYITTHAFLFFNAIISHREFTELLAMIIIIINNGNFFIASRPTNPRWAL